MNKYQQTEEPSFFNNFNKKLDKKQNLNKEKMLQERERKIFRNAFHKSK